MAVVEYAILRLRRSSAWSRSSATSGGTFPVTRGWFSFSGIGGHGSLAAGFLIAVFMSPAGTAPCTSTRRSRTGGSTPAGPPSSRSPPRRHLHPGAVGLQGVVSPAKLQANSSSALVYVAQALGGGGWAKVMALALALSVIATTGTSIVLTARIMYGMASHRVLPRSWARSARRFKTPATGSVSSACS